VVEQAFGAGVDYAMLVKIYGNDGDPDTRYSPAVCTGCRSTAIIGHPDPRHISTSHVERQNWSVRTMVRRYTRLSNGFSRKIENHASAVALTYFAYNFIRIHRSLRVSPAMAAGITDYVWTIEEIAALPDGRKQDDTGVSRPVKLGISSLVLLLAGLSLYITPGGSWREPIIVACIFFSAFLSAFAARYGSKWWLLVAGFIVLFAAFAIFLAFHAY
jgi:hypothetical protein